jgi:nucleoside-diphosphate-sugar epimerase
MICQQINPEAAIKHVPYEQAYGVPFEDTHRRVPDVERAAAILGFRAKTPFEEGLQRTISWFQEKTI